MTFTLNNSGKILTSEEANALTFNGVFQGFLSRTDIESLLGQSNCAGIRVYNAVGAELDHTRRVIAVGIRANGTEKDARGGVGYLLSGAFNPNSALASTAINSRENAANLVFLSETEFGASVQFSSVFSKETLVGLLQDKDGEPVAGIGFFTSIFSNLRTHTAASFVFSGSLLSRVPNNPVSSHIQSNLPCPGFCAVPTVGDSFVDSDDPTETAISTAEASGIYLVKWRNF